MKGPPPAWWCKRDWKVGDKAKWIGKHAVMPIGNPPTAMWTQRELDSRRTFHRDGIVTVTRAPGGIAEIAQFEDGEQIGVCFDRVCLVPESYEGWENPRDRLRRETQVAE